MTSRDPLKEVEALLNQTIGLDVRSVGPSMVALASRTRMNKRGIKNPADYVAYLAGSAAEMQSLVEEIVVPETWFFRDRQPFFALGEWAANEWLPVHPYGVLRILSVPCSTGEEPFSIVMALLDAGLSPERFTVEAVDISAVALDRARTGLYSLNSFRGEHLDYREKYFRQTPKGWRISESVREQVQFRQANVLDASFVRKENTLNVIFCRNLLIYLDETARFKLMSKLVEALSPEDRIFLGHAEGGIARSFGLEAIPLPGAFAFRKIQPRKEAPNPSAAKVKKSVSLPKIVPPQTVVPAALPLKPIPQIPARRASAKATTVPVPTPEIPLDQARQLADAGKFDAARQACEASLRAHGPSSQTYYLLGLIDDAVGMTDKAEEFYRKALYLEPDHCETLFQLSLLAKKSGDAKAARRLHERAKRAQTKLTTP